MEKDKIFSNKIIEHIEPSLTSADWYNNYQICKKLIEKTLKTDEKPNHKAFFFISMILQLEQIQDDKKIVEPKDILNHIYYLDKNLYEYIERIEDFSEFIEMHNENRLTEKPMFHNLENVYEEKSFVDKLRLDIILIAIVIYFIITRLA
jgi:superfamily I DNA/RNA helicase